MGKDYDSYNNPLRNPKIALDVCDPTNLSRTAAIRGRVKKVTFEGAEEYTYKLAKKYLGVDKYQNRQPGMRRALIKIEASHVFPPWEDKPSLERTPK
jgi:hypothetical protein